MGCYLFTMNIIFHSQNLQLISGVILCGKRTLNLIDKNDDTNGSSYKRDRYCESSGAASSSPSGTPSGTDHPGHVVGSADQDQEAEACSSTSTTQRGKELRTVVRP